MMHYMIAAVALAAGLAACATSEPAQQRADTCAVARPHASGLTQREITSGGQARAYALYVPASYTGSARAPLVFDIHGSGGSPDTILTMSGLVAEADARGFIIAAPVGATTRPNMNGFTWNVPQQAGAPDDVAFTSDMIDQISAELCIDDARIYAMGYSGGARLASELACRMPHRIAAIATIAGLRHPMGAEGACLAEGGATSIISFHGEADGVNAYAVTDANRTATWTYGVDDALARWAAAMRCGPARNEVVEAGIMRVSYAGCVEDAEIVHYRMAEAGHIWPGTQARLHPSLGQTEGRINATALSLDFFAAHARR